MKKAIDIRDLKFQYPTTSDSSPFVLELNSWSLAYGDKAVLHGPSGCGKSTLLNLISGALKMQSGHLEVCGVAREQQNETERRAHRIETIGFVFQDFTLVSYLSALENVLLPYRINPILHLNRLVQERAVSLLRQLGLEGKEIRFPFELSQGERQRVAIARALITEPRLLLADEPTAGLDPQRSESVMDLLEKLVQERESAMLVVTHDPVIKTRFSHQLSFGDR